MFFKISLCELVNCCVYVIRLVVQCSYCGQISALELFMYVSRGTEYGTPDDGYGSSVGTGAGCF